MPALFHYFEYSVDVCFALDILITLNTAYRDEEGMLVNHRWQILKKYARGWMAIDVISILPLHMLYAHRLTAIAR